MKIDILTIFPEMCESVMSESIIGRARNAGKVEIGIHNIRDYTKDKHNRTDDEPYGGGMGMVMTAQPIYDCFNSLFDDECNRPHLIYLSPKGQVFNQGKAIELLQYDRIALLCGHYEGVDQRVLDEIVDEEISVGDFVVTGGELPAMIVADAVCRMLPGVLSDEACFSEESHFDGLLEYPQYTRPAIWNGREVPEVLLSGHHKNIQAWRKEQSEEITERLRPDMMEKYLMKKASENK